MLSRRKFVALAGAAFASATGVGLYSWRVEPTWVEVVRRRMPLEHLPPHLVGRTLLQISDIHVGPRVSSEFLIDAFTAARTLEPDFVALTGDFVSYRSAREIDELARVLEHLPRGRLATVGSLGNHDYGIAWRQLGVADAITGVAARAGMTVLRNEVRTVSGLQLAGLGDYWSPEFGSRRGVSAGLPGRTKAGLAHELVPAPTSARTALASLAPRVPTIVLSHNPDAQDEPMWDGVRGWVLAGHTHGGQVKPPFLPPPILPVENRRYSAGSYDVGPGRTLYVNRGLGYLIRVRLNARPELTLFTLERADTPGTGAPEA
jgi:hypothetical protein